MQKVKRNELRLTKSFGPPSNINTWRSPDLINFPISFQRRIDQFRVRWTRISRTFTQFMIPLVSFRFAGLAWNRGSRGGSGHGHVSGCQSAGRFAKRNPHERNLLAKLADLRSSGSSAYGKAGSIIVLETIFVYLNLSISLNYCIHLSFFRSKNH